MKRPPFDLGLWALCTAAPFAVLGVPIGLNWHDQGWAAVAVWLTGAAVVSVFMGWALYDGCRRLGWRVSRPRPDQAEDYGDRP